MAETREAIVRDIVELDESLAQSAIARGENLIENTFLLGLEDGGLREAYTMREFPPTEADAPTDEQLVKLRAHMRTVATERGLTLGSERPLEM